MPKGKDVCLLKGCGNEEFSRGLCQAHYKQARLRLDAEVESEEELIERGLMLPAKRAGRKTKVSFASAVERAKAKKQ